jgi:hypothetical protein
MKCEFGGVAEDLVGVLELFELFFTASALSGLHYLVWVVLVSEAVVRSASRFLAF